LTSVSSSEERGWPARFPLLQVPNVPLAVALVALLVGALTNGSVHFYARGAFYTALAAWAWGEMVGGVNWARRVIGAVALVYIAVKLGLALGA
jgi:hypothetical protein